MHRMFERLGLAAAAGVIVTTPELQAHVAGRVRSPDVVHLIPNGVDTALFRPAPRTPAPARSVLYVGRLSPEKNLGAVLEAAARLRDRVELTVTFTGDGPLREALAADARRLGVRLERKPVVDHRTLPALYAAADVFVLPSFTEGHAKVLLEAMACGLPCVASDVGGNRQVLVNGRTGLLVDPRDHAGLAAALQRALGDKDLARSLGEHARQEVLARYDLGANVRREIDLLRRVGAGRA